MAKIAQSLTGVRQHQRSQSRRKLYGAIAAHIALIGLSIVFFLPFLWLLSTSLKPEWQIFTFPPVWIPDPVTFEHYGTE